MITREPVRDRKIAAGFPINSSSFFSKELEESRQLLQIVSLNRSELHEQIRHTKEKVELSKKLIRGELTSPETDHLLSTIEIS
jgi:hypothetical protein